MAAKTIPIDMEAYEILSRARRGNESFSTVIKQTLPGASNSAAALLHHLATYSLPEAVLDDMDRVVARREEGPARQKLAFLGETPIYVARVTVLYPDESFSTLYGEAASHLLSSGTPIPVMDLMIGIVAKARSLPLLTRDTRHFDRIPGLVVEGY